MAKPEANANANTNTEDSVWKVTPSTDSIFNADTTFFEPINIQILESILFSGWDKGYSTKEIQGKEYIPTAVKHLKNIEKRINNNHLEVKWKVSTIKDISGFLT